MPNTQPPKAREMVLLDVHEVSLVDRPAIRRVFLAKRTDEDSPTDPSEVEVLALYKRDGFDLFKVAAAQPAEITTALGIVVPMLRRMASQLSGEDKTALMRTAGLMAQLQGGSMPLPDPNATAPGAPAPGGPPKPPSPLPPKPPVPGMPSDEEMKAKALALEEKEKALAEKEKALTAKEKALEVPEKLAKERKEKALADAASEPYAMLTPSGLIPVAKGRKMLTEEREKMLAEGLASVAKAFASVAGEEKVKMVFANLLESFKDLPEGVTIDQQVTPKGEGKPILKSEIAEVLKDVLGPIATRMEAVEKSLNARPPGSVTPAEGTERTSVRKSQSIFTGVI